MSFWVLAFTGALLILVSSIDIMLRMTRLVTPNTDYLGDTWDITEYIDSTPTPTPTPNV